MGANPDSLSTVATHLVGQTGDFSWWQTVGGSLVVFVLLLLCLRLLSRWYRPGRHGQASLLAVWSLGPRREIQILRLQDDVHYIYRHENALVLLKRQAHADYLATQPVAEQGQESSLRARLLGRGFLARLVSLPRTSPALATLPSEDGERA
jgi:hypothetical protein